MLVLEEEQTRTHSTRERERERDSVSEVRERAARADENAATMPPAGLLLRPQNATYLLDLLRDDVVILQRRQPKVGDAALCIRHHLVPRFEEGRLLLLVLLLESGLLLQHTHTMHKRGVRAAVRAGVMLHCCATLLCVAAATQHTRTSFSSNSF